MITKTYRSKSDISVNVVMPNGKSLHVAFSPVTGGGSTYTTSDERVQKALEGHYRYGKMFKLVSTQGVASSDNAAKVEKKVKQVVPKVADIIRREKSEEEKTSIVEDLLNKGGVPVVGSEEENNDKGIGGAEDEVVGDGEVANVGADMASEGGTGVDEQGDEAIESEVVGESDLAGKTVISVSCPDDAKEYLVEKFGISRTKLRWLKQIKEQAEANGIIFEGI